MHAMTRQQAIEHAVLGGELPTVAQVRRFLRYNPYVAYRTKVLAVYIVGSVARGTSHRESDLDLAVIIPHKARKSALKVTEHYHARFTCNSQKPTWQGKQVDLQFFYADDKALAGYSKIAL